MASEKKIPYRNEDLQDFLAANFYKDMQNVPNAVQEYIEREQRDQVVKMIYTIEEFFKMDLSEVEKNNFIEKYTEIDFARFGVSPVDWFEGLLLMLKEVHGTK